MALEEAHLAEAFRRQGLRYFGWVPLQESATFPIFESWLAAGHHGSMSFLERNSSLRRHPQGLLQGARSALLFGLAYGTGDRHLPRANPKVPRIAMYARYRDYHRTMRRAGEAVLDELGIPSSSRRICVDSAPLLERDLFARLPQGFVGKNSCWIHEDEGSLFLLGEALLVDEAPSSLPTKDPKKGCGTCRRCEVHCPTGALLGDRTLDARRCLSYWTIEHRGTIPEEFWPWLRYYWYGCDICQTVCPFNRGKKAQNAPPVHIAEMPDLADVATISHERYEKLFGGTPMTRAKREGLRRNALIAMTVTEHPALDSTLSFWLSEGALLAPSLQATLEQVGRWRTNREQRRFRTPPMENA